MTAKEIKDYLRTEETILWEELSKVETKLDKRGLSAEEQRKQPEFILALGHWAIVWEINRDLKINTEE